MLNVIFTDVYEAQNIKETVLVTGISVCHPPEKWCNKQHENV
jgi:hypothetical protein